MDCGEKKRRGMIATIGAVRTCRSRRERDREWPVASIALLPGRPGHNKKGNRQKSACGFAAPTGKPSGQSALRDASMQKPNREFALWPSCHKAAQKESKTQDSVAVGAGVHDFFLQFTFDLSANFALLLRIVSIEYDGFIAIRALCHRISPFVYSFYRSDLPFEFRNLARG
jgi:hypothetical protein